MIVIKSRKTPEFIDAQGEPCGRENAHVFNSKSQAATAMEVWGLETECRVRRVISRKG